MSPSLSLEILKGGPLDGLPAFFLRFEKEEQTFGWEAFNKNAYPLPLHLRIIWVEGNATGLEDLLSWCSSLGITTSVEIYGAFEGWMRHLGRRLLHTSDDLVPYPVEEVIFHTETPPAPKFYPFHFLQTPMMWWAPTSKDFRLQDVPLGMRLWLPRKAPVVRLFPKEEA